MNKLSYVFYFLLERVFPALLEIYKYIVLIGFAILIWLLIIFGGEVSIHINWQSAVDLWNAL